MDSKKFNKKMADVKELDELREKTKAIELGPKFLEVFEQLKEICEHERKQRHCEDKGFEFQFKCSVCGKKIVRMTVDIEEVEISINYKVNGEDDVRTIRSSDIDNKPYIDIDKDIEWMDDLISDYFAAKDHGGI